MRNSSLGEGVDLWVPQQTVDVESVDLLLELYEVDLEGGDEVDLVIREVDKRQIPRLAGVVDPLDSLDLGPSLRIGRHLLAVSLLGPEALHCGGELSLVHLEV